MSKLAVKRAIDVAVSLGGLALLSPVFVAAGIAIKLDSKGRVFYLQERIGLNGKPFNIVKFRSMVINAENIGLKHRVVQNDPRITKVGYFLRKTSIDELPQFFNILVGQMSLVGPRPTLRFQVEKYSDFQKQRLLMKPGVTGLAQCRGRKRLNWNQRIRLDVLYVNKHSLCLDTWIVIQTAKSLFRTEDVYREQKSWINS